MQVYSQKSISTTLPWSPDMVNGDELIHSGEGAGGAGAWIWWLEEEDPTRPKSGAATGNSGAKVNFVNPEPNELS
jgi:hypothetical protein